MAGEKWEYDIVLSEGVDPKNIAEDFLSLLNEKGKEGWEFVRLLPAEYADAMGRKGILVRRSLP